MKKAAFFRSCRRLLFCLSACLPLGMANAVLSCTAPRPTESGGAQPAPQDTCTALFILPQTADFMTTDALLNAYLVLPSAELLRYDSTGSLQARYGNFDRGALSEVDVSNPLRPLLFYRDFSELVVLDPQFAELATLSLRDLDLPDARAVCRARDNNLWVYEASESLLYKISERGEKLLESDPLRLRLPQSDDWSFSAMRESEHYVLLWAPGRGFVLFDAFARFLRFIPLEGVRSWQMLDEDVFLLLQGDKAVFFFPETGEIQPLSLPCSPFPMRQLELQAGRYYLRSEEKVGVYSLE